MWATKNRRPWLDPEWRRDDCSPALVKIVDPEGRKAALRRRRAGPRASIPRATRRRDHRRAGQRDQDQHGPMDSSQLSASTDFKWQHGYGAFSVTPFDDALLRDTSETRRRHHRESMPDEYRPLARHGVTYDRRMIGMTEPSPVPSEADDTAGAAAKQEHGPPLEVARWQRIPHSGTPATTGQLPPQPRHPPPHRAVEHPVAHADDGPAQDLRVHRDTRQSPASPAAGSALPRSSASASRPAFLASVTPARTRLSFWSSSAMYSCAISRRICCRPRFTSA